MGLIEFGRWRSSAVTEGGVINGVYTNPTTPMGTASDWMGVPSRTPLHIQSPGGREGVLTGHLFPFPKGSMAWAPTSFPGVSPGTEPKHRWGEAGLVGEGGCPVASAWPPRCYFFSFLPDFFLLPLPPCRGLAITLASCVGQSGVVARDVDILVCSRAHAAG